jgi:phosphopantetheinyl transferase
MNAVLTVGRTTRPTVRASRDKRHAENLALARRLIARALPCGPGAVALDHDHTGRPVILVNDRPGPRVSFSHLGRFTWAALSFGRRSVGIDAVSEEEFREPYPFSRAFHAREWALAARIFPPSCAASLLWSAKEAAVKAWGCGFRFLDPREVSVAPLEDDENARLFSRIMSEAHVTEADGHCFHGRRVIDRVPAPLDFKVSARVDAKPEAFSCGRGVAWARCFPIGPETWLSVVLTT